MTQARGYAAPAPQTEEEEGKIPVTGAQKRKAVNLQGHFVPASTGCVRELCRGGPLFCGDAGHEGIH